MKLPISINIIIDSFLFPKTLAGIIIKHGLIRYSGLNQDFKIDRFQFLIEK